MELSSDQRELLQYLIREAGTDAGTRAPIARQTQGERILSFSQQRLWFLDQWAQGTATYNILGGIRVKGSLRVDLLEQCINEIIRRHESLRSGFDASNGSQVLKVAPELTLRIPVVDLQGMEDSEREAEARRLATEEAQTGFDLRQMPLIRVKLMRMGPEDHVMLVTMHHIISDAWSHGILVREFSALYAAFARGQPSPLPDLPIQYSDFAFWQKQQLQGEQLERDLAFWRKHLAGKLPILELPTSRPRSEMRSYRGSRRDLALKKELADELKRLSQGQGITLFMTLAAAFSVLLHRYTGQDDLLLGTPIAGRNRAELENLIGFFINTLPARFDLCGNPTVKQLLQAVREVVLDVFTHDEVPFEKLVDELQPKRNLSHTPLFQVMFALQNAPTGELRLPGLEITSFPIDSETSKFDLTLIVSPERQGGLHLSMEFCTDLFDGEWVEGMLGHLECLLKGMVSGEGRRIRDLRMLGEPERQRWLGWNREGRDYGAGRCLHEVFEEQVRMRPQAPAVECGAEVLSYAQLNQRANQLADCLRGLGVGPESRVGLYVERSVGLVVGVLGILKAGGAYVPLDPAYPEERLQFMMEDADVQVMVLQQGLGDKLGATGRQVVRLGDDGGIGPGYRTEDVASGAGPENVAYMIYTSGSTGRPKGVEVSHRNVWRLFAATGGGFGFGAEDVWTLFHSYAFDFSVWELWGALLYGGRLVVVPYWVSRSPEEFYQLLQQKRVTVLNQTPWAFYQLMGVDAASGEGDLALRLVIFGGEALDVGRLKGWFARHGEGKPQLVNMYGITETTVHVTQRWLREADAQGGAGSVIGKAIGDLELYVLDEGLEPVPAGVSGELYVGGQGLARGYRGCAEQTAERFIPSPWGRGERLYRTGDLGRYQGDGDLEYWGRKDQQVKVRGFRIELGEIEGALVGHPGVAEAVVMARQDGGGERYLVGYVVGRAGQEVRGSELREYVKGKLPEYMVPSAWVMLSGLPLTVNGKVDRKGLPEPEGGRPELSGGYVGPRNEVEEMLAGIWSKVLGVEPVGVHDNFFELGGDSILSVRIISFAKQRGFQITLPQLFKHQTIECLAREISANHVDGEMLVPSQPFSLISEEERQKLPPGLEDAYPLTMLQAGMHYHMALAPDSAVYHNVNSWHLRAPFDSAKFQQALQVVVDRHPVLRTSFDLSNYSTMLQLVHRNATLPISVEDLRALPYSEQERLIAEYVERERRHKFDLSRPPLLRFHIQRRTEGSFQFTLTEHHAVFDGWSLTSTLAEIFDHYLALVNNQAPPVLAQLQITFRDYVRLELAALQSKDCQRFWANQLKDCIPVRLHRWTRSHPQEHPQVRRIELTVPPAVGEALGRLARSEVIPLKSVLMAAHAKVMSFITGQSDVLTGMALNGRPEEADGDRVRGLFLNTVPFRVKLPPGTWRDLVRAVFKSEQELLPYRRYPLLALERDLGVVPLCPTAFNFVHFYSVRDTLKPGKISILEGGYCSEETHFDLLAHFRMCPLTSQLSAVIDLNGQLVHQTQANAIAGYYRSVLEAMAAQPDDLHQAKALISPAERLDIVERFNATQSLYPRDKCIHELVEEHARRDPEAVAVVCGGETLTYGELDRRANRLARELQARGVGVEERVGICVERSVGMIVGLLGILKAGAAYVPLDPEYPQERINYLLGDAGVRVVVSQAGLRERLQGFEGVVLGMEDLDWEQVPGEEHRGLPAVSSQNLAYVMYTSGSTGKPKGVEVVHRGVVRLLRGVEYVRLGPGERVLQMAPLSFDASTFEIWGALVHGGRCVVVRERVLGGQELKAELRKQEVSVMWATASLFNALVDEDVEIFSGVKQLLIGGEALSGRHVRVAGEHLAGTQIINGYGPTEGTTFSCCYAIGAGEPGSEASVPIGRPISNTRVYVLDGGMRPVPAGVVGELYIGGDGLARGYLGRAELTAEKFVPDPFGVEAGGRLYRSGDLCRWLGDGNVEFMGRRDDQVKVRGYRIELGEVESALREQAGVKEAVVVVRGEGAEKQLVGYVVMAQGQEGQAEQVREGLRGRLPEYMLPGVILRLDGLPLTPNGKVDRRHLPEPWERGYALAGLGEGPRTPVEEVLCGIWQEVLKREQVAREADFFALGGHSLSATQVISRVRQTLGVELPLRRLFEYPTVAGLAEQVQLEKDKEHGLPVEPIVPVDRVGDIPLSYAQERMWFLSHLQAERPTYNIYGILRVGGRLDRTALEHATNEVVRRHEVLRTTFEERAGKTVQVIEERRETKVEWEDLTQGTEQDKQLQVERLAEEEIRKPFDLAKGPLLRVRVMALGAQEHVVLFTMHHIVADGWSIGVMQREIQVLYEAYVRGEKSPLPEMRIQYADFAVWQRKWLEGRVLEQQLSYWKRQLGENLPVLELPMDRPRPAVQSYHGAMEQMVLGREILGALKVLSQQQGATLFMTLLAVFKVLLSRYSGQKDIVVGTPIANRNRKEIEGLIGFFVNTLVLRSDLGGEPTFLELLRRVKEVTLQAYTHQDMPFEQLVQELQPERDLSRSPLFQVMFVIENALSQELRKGKLSSTPVRVETGTTKFDLTLALSETGEGLLGKIEYNTDLFDPETIRRMTRHYEQLIREVVKNPEGRIGDLPMLGEAERQRWLGWNRRGQDFGAGKCLHEVFEEQVRLRPQAGAVECGAEVLSYAQLNQRANQLADCLRGLGVGPESRVGLYVGRSLGLVVGMLGILKAGGAYVPLDPVYPKERLQWIMEDAGVQVVVTQEGLEEQLAVGDRQIVRLAEDGEMGPEHTTEDVASGVVPENVAYVIYTSGSTGRPKGVEVTHGNVWRLFAATAGGFGFGAEDVWTLFHSYAFDFSVWELWGALLYGGRLVVVPYWVSRSPEEFYQLLEQKRVTVLNQTPWAFYQLMGVDAGRGGGDLALRLVIFGGEALEVGRLKGWFERHGESRPQLVNMYGITETTVHVTQRWLRAADAQVGASSVIGQAIGDLELYVLDEGLEPVPAGVTGELYVGGKGLARGYCGAAEQTAQRFIPSPWGRGERLYRTGDLGRYRGDGDLEYWGRKDQQVKVRGFRIELGEIEGAVVGHPGVAEAVVVARQDAGGERYLVGYVVGREGQEVTGSELREYLKGKLPEYMVPALIMRLECLPLTPNGKVDRRHLPEPAEWGQRAAEFQPPQSETERLIANVWRECLSIERIGLADNFFDLGGNSIRLVQVHQRLKARVQKPLSLVDLFHYPTVGDLAKYLHEQEETPIPCGKARRIQNSSGRRQKRRRLREEALSR